MEYMIRSWQEYSIADRCSFDIHIVSLDMQTFVDATQNLYAYHFFPDVALQSSLRPTPLEQLFSYSARTKRGCRFEFARNSRQHQGAKMATQRGNVHSYF